MRREHVGIIGFFLALAGGAMWASGSPMSGLEKLGTIAGVIMVAAALWPELRKR